MSMSFRRGSEFSDLRGVARLSIDVSAVDDPDSKRFSRTQQSFKEETDINSIMKRFEKTGMIDHLNEFEGKYGDFTELPTTYHEAVNQVIAAEEMFMTIPAKVRARFDNDPGAFLDFVSNPDNAEAMYELGLARRSVETPDASPSSSPADRPPAQPDAEGGT